ncbi:prepilin peptidase [Alcaligenaceae bacterium]|nr:prepilin peptidase [Alcaligenaceae bacterium]
MMLQEDFQLWQIATLLAPALLGAAAGVWCVRAARVYARLLAMGAQADATSLVASLRMAARPRRRGTAKASATVSKSAWPWVRGISVLSAAALAVVFAAAIIRYGYTPAAMLLAVAACMLMLLAHIDARTRLLPDALTLPMLWLGLSVAWLGWGAVSLHDAVAGAMAGYGFLWLLLQAFRLLRGVEGMGHGDLKLLAALGAWLGWQSLPWVLLAACVTGIVFAMLKGKTFRPSGAYPFGPFLAAAGVAVFTAPPELHLYFY